MAGEGGEHAVSGLEEWQWPVVEELYRMYTQVRLAMYSVQCTVYSVQCTTVYSDIQETRETVIIQRQPPRSVSSDLCTGCSLQLHGGQVSPYHYHDPGLEAWRAPGGPLHRPVLGLAAVTSAPRMMSYSRAVSAPPRPPPSSVSLSRSSLSSAASAVSRTTAALCVLDSLLSLPQSPPLPDNTLFRSFNLEQLEAELARRQQAAGSRSILSSHWLISCQYSPLIGSRYRERRGSGSSSGGCGFCRKNGEPASIFTGHRLQERGIVTCPYLR